MSRLSLRTRMAIVFGLLMISVAVFMVKFFPARMAEQAHASAQLRAHTVTQVMASALAPALEFGDADNANLILSWLASTPDARFAVLVDDDGHRLAAWSPANIPAVLPRRDSEIRDHVLVTIAPVIGRGGGRGTLYIGQSLDRVVADREAAQQTAVTASAIVLLIGLIACVIIAATLVRPIERLTAVAHDIAKGRKPPKIDTVTGGIEVMHMTTALGTMLDRLNDANSQLVEASRHAGMAEVATGMLHNVGNILTSVNVGIESVAERVGALPAERVRRASTLLVDAGADKLPAAAKYLGAIADAIDQDRQTLLAALVTLRGHVDHVNRVVTMQNAYACSSNLVDRVDLTALVDEALAIGCPDATRQLLCIERHIEAATVVVDRHRLLQIMVNLIANARDSLTALGRSSTAGELRLSITCEVDDEWLELRVDDNGTGIAPECLTRIFTAGFTTKPKGHGYGLHSSALAAEQLGGTLRCFSDGPGKGASFVLCVPISKG